MAGPATSLAICPVTTYNPAPTVAPTPMEVKSNILRHRRRGEFERSLSISFRRDRSRRNRARLIVSVISEDCKTFAPSGFSVFNTAN